MRAAIGIITLVTGLLITLGVTTLHSIAMHEQDAVGMFRKQCAWIGLGLVLCVITAAIDYRRTRALPYVLLVVTAVMLILARVPGIGEPINGAWRWIKIKGVGSLQPSEFAKIAVILAIAAYAHQCQRLMSRFTFGLIYPGAVLGVMLALVLLGKDLGTTALIALLSACMLYAAGTRLRHLLPVSLVGMALLCTYLATDPVRWRRVDAFLHPELYQETIAHQSEQSKIAIGAGGLKGLGLGNGIQKSGFVPEQSTDFILSVIGEELGLRVTLPLVAAYFAFTAAAFAIARRAADTYGSLTAFGIGCLVGLQAIINIAVTTASVPNKGLALPFVSYGGSCMLSLLVLVGFLISVARHAPADETAPVLVARDERDDASLQNA